MRKYTKRFLIPLTPFELEALRYLMLKQRLSMGAQARQAVRAYVRAHPGFDAEDFERYLREEVLPKVESAAEKKQMTEELESFLADDQAPVRGMPRVAVSSAHDFK